MFQKALGGNPGISWIGGSWTQGIFMFISKRVFSKVEKLTGSEQWAVDPGYLVGWYNDAYV